MPFIQGASGKVHYRRWSVDEPRAGLIFLHGRGQHSGDYHRFARLLNKSDIEVWALDHVGHGMTEGELGDHGPIEDLAANTMALAAIAEADRPGLPIGLMGHSLGAGTAVVALQTLPHDFVAFVGCGTPKAVVALEGPLPKVSTLLVHGVDDRLSPIDSVRGLLPDWPSARLHEYENAGHDLLHEPVHPEVTDEIVRFLLDHLS